MVFQKHISQIRPSFSFFSQVNLGLLTRSLNCFYSLHIFLRNGGWLFESWQIRCLSENFWPSYIIHTCQHSTMGWSVPYIYIYIFGGGGGGGGGGEHPILINVFEFPIFSASWYFSNKYFPNQTFSFFSQVNLGLHIYPITKLLLLTTCIFAEGWMIFESWQISS